MGLKIIKCVHMEIKGISTMQVCEQWPFSMVAHSSISTHFVGSSEDGLYPDRQEQRKAPCLWN